MVSPAVLRQARCDVNCEGIVSKLKTACCSSCHIHTLVNVLNRILCMLLGPCFSFHCDTLREGQVRRTLSSMVQSVVVETHNPTLAAGCEDSPSLPSPLSVLHVVYRDAGRPDHILTKGCGDRDYSLSPGVTGMRVESGTWMI